MPSSRNDSHLNSVQKTLIGVSTALTATIFMTISIFVKIFKKEKLIQKTRMELVAHYHQLWQHVYHKKKIYINPVKSHLSMLIRQLLPHQDTEKALAH